MIIIKNFLILIIGILITYIYSEKIHTKIKNEFLNTFSVIIWLLIIGFYNIKTFNYLFLKYVNIQECHSNISGFQTFYALIIAIESLYLKRKNLK